MADQRIDFKKEAESEGVAYQNQPQRETRPQLEKELRPDYYQRQERERSR